MWTHSARPAALQRRIRGRRGLIGLVARAGRPVVRLAATRHSTSSSSPPDVPPGWPHVLRHHVARAGRVLAADLRHSQHAGVRHPRGGRSAGSCRSPIGLLSRLQGRLDRPRADVGQRHLHRDPAVSDPGAVLFRDARSHVVGCAGRHHGAAGLGLRRASDPLRGDQPAQRASSPRPASSPA